MKSGTSTGNTTDNKTALETLLAGEASRMLHQHSATVLAKYGHIRTELEKLHNSVTLSKNRINIILKNSRKKLNPLWNNFDPTGKAGMDDLSIFRFLNRVGGSVIDLISNSYARLNLIDTYAQILLPVLSATKDIELTSLVLAEENGANLIGVIREEYRETILNFEKLLGGVYLTTRNEYKKLRKKFLGGSNVAPDNDSVEDQLMMSFFGSKPPKHDIEGPAMALVDDNCVLTQLLSELSNSLPKYYEKVTPLLKRGKPTGKTHVVKTLDNGEIEDWAGTMMSIAEPTYWGYVNQPQKLTTEILAAIKDFQIAYGTIANSLYEVVKKADLVNDEEDRRRIIEDPSALVKQYNRINFLNIRPSAEDIAPRTKMDHDVSIARTKLFLHLQETLNALSGMSRYEQSSEDYAVLRIKESIEIKKTMDEILKSEEQKRLALNIQDENEFYVGTSGQLGSIGVERQPAPKITYDDVVGESFVKAKQHIEEVVKVASHPNIMRLSAPRGDVKSNLLLIGPYGCGKTEITKAIGADKRIIGFNVSTADLLTAYMHESVKNVKRMFDHAKDLRRNSRHTKPVGILMDEFDRLFNYGEGAHQAYDGGRMTGVLQEMMDGVVGYEGVFLVGLTNVPKDIPEAIRRRFKYIDVVGQLNAEERTRLFKMFLTRGLPVDPSVSEEDYAKWSEILVDAPGDVIGKVCDEIHFKFMHELVTGNPEKIRIIEKNLSKRLREREQNKQDYTYVKKALSEHRFIKADEITAALTSTINQPQVKMQINKAKQVYKEAEDIMNGLTVVGDTGLGFGAKVGKKSSLWQ